MTVPAEGDWSYTSPDASERDEVRFYLGDVDPSLKLLADSEIDFLIERWGKVYDSLVYVAAVAADLIANRMVSLVTVSGDGVSVDAAQLATRFRELAVQLRATYRAGAASGTPDLSNLMIGSTLDPGIEPLVFSIGQHDNINAGQQNYGGKINPWKQASEAAELTGGPG